jgi:DAACS family dicarboxylate/amino acid:cation (Na+ or H+) symporter
MEPLLLAFTTASSEVTLPVHMQILEKAGIPNKIVSFVLPLGYSFNLDGAALYQSLVVCFLAEAYGLHLDTPSIITILITTLIANKGTANVPAASLVVIAVILTSIGLPVEAIAIVAGVDRFMDMGRTTVNVFGNTIAAILLFKFGGKHLADEPAA